MEPTVVVAHNAVAPGADPSTQDVESQAQLVLAALEELGVACCRQAVRDPATAVLPGGVVFNLVEAAPGDPEPPLRFVERLEAAGIRFTGSGSAALRLSTDKLACKRHLENSGLPVAPGERYTPPTPGVPGPWILKPAQEDASLGLEGNPLCTTEEQLARRAAALRERFPGQELVVETFLPGREFNVSLLQDRRGFRVLPVAEMRFLPAPGFVPLVSYEAKWCPGSLADRCTVRVFPDPREALVAQVASLAVAAVEACGLRGYARVDLRCDAEGQPRILEVNANPCLSPEAGFMAAAKRAGLAPREVVAAILAAAEAP